MKPQIKLTIISIVLLFVNCACSTTGQKTSSNRAEPVLESATLHNDVDIAITKWLYVVEFRDGHRLNRERGGVGAHSSDADHVNATGCCYKDIASVWMANGQQLQTPPHVLPPPNGNQYQCQIDLAYTISYGQGKDARGRRQLKLERKPKVVNQR